MSQQIMTIVSLEGIDLGDLEFIRDQVKAGNWLEAHGAINAVTNEISIIPASGKTFYAYRGKIDLTSDNAFTRVAATVQITTNKVTATYKVNGTPKDTARVGNKAIIGIGSSVDILNGGAGVGGDLIGRFDVAGLSLVGNGVKKVTIENTLDNGSADATMSGWIETT